ncbi:substrate-binding domain-containing protein [Rothia sp. ZJ1223]|uniref:substrate-binding domain-containing protein n=1 Tax=Rothia sp. ZJ1223 TaxID=2811098 RepID=UPI0019577D7B|nr:substrate-binding domain-containing protein [Rothia sp. ZJ1223]MBM7051476.1 substrate-binding domain-containing protein [Rothia sp. ZJ1223]
MSKTQSRREALEQRRKKDIRKWVAAGGAAVVLLGGGALAFNLLDDSSRNSALKAATEIPAECSTTQRINVAASEKLAAIIEMIPVSAEDCISLEVDSSASPTEVASNIIGGANVPHIWIPDSSVRAMLELQGKAGVTTITDSLASTPAVLISDENINYSTWSDAVKDADNVSMSDPKVDGGAFASLISVASEVGNQKASTEDLKAGSGLRAQTIGVEAPVKSASDLLSDVDAGTIPAAVVTEADYAQYALDAKNPSILVSIPSSGTTVLDYPLMVPDVNASNSTVTTAAQKIADFVASEEGKDALAEAGLRTSSGDILSEETSVGEPTQLEVADKETLTNLWTAYSLQSAPLNGLIVIDSSGSMEEPVAGTDKNRMQVTTEAALAGSQLFPARDSLGVWAFAREIGEDAQGAPTDYKQLAPIRGIEEEVEGRTHREVIQQVVSEMSFYPKAQTGLYDSLLASFREMKANYKPGAANVVVFMTDGANFDEGSISREDMIAAIQAEQDPNNPVLFVLIGISEDADLEDLKTIAPQIGGQVFEADNASDIQRVFQQAFSADAPAATEEQQQEAAAATE